MMRTQVLESINNISTKWLVVTISALVDVSVGERRHELLVAARLGVTVAFLRL